MKAHVFFALVSATLPALAAGAGEPTKDQGRIIACSEIADAATRLACFDAESKRLGAATGTKTDTPAPPSAGGSATGSGTTSLPSLGEEQLRRNDSSAEREEQSLQAKIAETRRGSGGLYYVTLDNGQMWRHEEGSMAPYLRKGAAVTITSASLGSYRMTLDAGSSKNWVRVTRIR